MKLQMACASLILLVHCAKPNPSPIEKSRPSTTAPVSPIQWQPWSEEVFTAAKRENKLIIMDLEAVWCHWCHVMEEKTYSNPEIVSLIQKSFLPVRVDQDARPDLSSLYGDYGWPATIVFDGDGKALTKQRGFIGPVGMKEMLQLLLTNPNDPLLLRDVGPAISESKSDFLNEDERLKLSKEQQSYYDEKEGGWGHRHKFLDQKSIENALADVSKDPAAKKMAIKTLDAAIGVVDPVWGGIYQYSTDGDWHHPHFEKIMSMQTQAITAYARGYLLLRDPVYRRVAEKIYDYLNTFLKDPNGAFYTSQDADLVQGEHAGEYFELGDAERRKQGLPRIDQNQYARENGWVIEAFAVLYGITGKEEVLSNAIKAAEWIVQNRQLKSGGFRHGDQDVGAYLGDSLAMGSAFLQLYAHTGNRKWLKLSQSCAKYIAKNFKNPDTKRFGFIPSVNKVAGKPVPPDRDENMDLARYANLLYRYTGQENYKGMAKQAMQYLLIPEVAYKSFTAGILIADREISQEPIHITVVGSKDDAQAKALFKSALAVPSLYRRTEWKDSKEGPLPNPDVDYPSLNRAAAFFCTQRLCSSPIFEIAELKNRIEKGQ